MRTLGLLLFISFTPSLLKAQSLLNYISIEYGNHCGFQSSSLEPIDAIDACCDAHDEDLATLDEAAKTYSIINANMKMCRCLDQTAAYNGQKNHDLYLYKLEKACDLTSSLEGQLATEILIKPAIKTASWFNSLYKRLLGE